jgi:DNA-binding CsgD family transcriptional regulator
MNILNGNQELKSLVQSYNLLPQGILWKNTLSQFILANNSAASLFGYDNGEEFLGEKLSDKDLKCKAKELACVFNKEDKKVIQAKKPLKKISYVCCAGNNWKLLLGTKTPVFDEHGDVSHIVVSYLDITDCNLSILNHDLLCGKRQNNQDANIQQSFIIDFQGIDSKLSPRQSECLFLLLRGKSSKQIGKALDISHRTVETHINNIKDQFNCYTKSELIERSISQGLLNHIPESLVNTVQ